jgi:glycosyltransferase involved in cell wall biosynthesis
MKVCVLSSVHPCFDVRIFEKQARSLSAAGYEVTLAGIADFKERFVEGIRVLGLPQPRSRALRPLNWWRILRIALREKAELYHVHDPELLPVCMLIRIATGRPAIYDVHENYPEDILTKEWIPDPLRQLVSAIFRAFEDQAVRLMDGVVVVNQHLEQRFAHKTRVATVRNYSRLEPFLESEGRTSRNDSRTIPYFVYAGRVSDDRGIHECLRALESLGDTGARLFCAGRIGHVSNETLRGLLQDRQPDKFFKYLGLLPYEEIPGLFRKALAGLLCFQPTPNNLLGTPNKLFEYMSAGIPVIASDFPFIREVVEDADCGLLVQPDDPGQIASAMDHLLHHPEVAARMGENGLRAARERYNWQLEERKLLSLYDEVLGKPPARA